MEGTIGEIRLFAGNFAPRSWNFCDGSTLSIAVYTALFSVIGTTYGGDGQTTFDLPDLRGRAAVGTGQGAGLNKITLGEMGGAESATMTTQQMPAHNHIVSATINVPVFSDTGTATAPGNTYLAGYTNAYTNQASDSHLAPVNVSTTLGVAGGGVPFSVMQPLLTLNYIICVEGIFPSRN